MTAKKKRHAKQEAKINRLAAGRVLGMLYGSRTEKGWLAAVAVAAVKFNEGRMLRQRVLAVMEFESNGKRSISNEFIVDDLVRAKVLAVRTVKTGKRGRPPMELRFVDDDIELLKIRAGIHG